MKMITEDIIGQSLKEVNAQYEQAIRQLAGLNRTIQNLQKYASHLINVGDFSVKPHRISNEAWRKRASEMIKELIKLNKKDYPTFNSVLVPIYIQLRNVYGVVLDQLRKDYRYNNDTLRYPSAFESISDDDMVRSIFDSLLVGLFPEDYFKDEALERIERGDNYEEIIVDDPPEEVILKIIAPLAVKRNDNSYGYIDTFKFVCNHMKCSWGNLQTRYINRNDVSEPPSKAVIIASNISVQKKFIKTVRALLADNNDL